MGPNSNDDEENEMSKQPESMACPNCLKPVEKPEMRIVEQDGKRKCSWDRDCPHCSAKLHQVVPFFKVNAYGWHWTLAPGQIG